jgi:hypothetical protein
MFITSDTATVRKRMGVVALAVPSQLSRIYAVEDIPHPALSPKGRGNLKVGGNT